MGSVLAGAMLLPGGMVGVVSRSGGTIGLVEALAPFATTARRGQLVSWLMGLVVFFNDDTESGFFISPVEISTRHDHISTVTR